MESLSWQMACAQLDIDVLWVPKPRASRAIQEPGTVRSLGEPGWPKETLSNVISPVLHIYMMNLFQSGRDLEKPNFTHCLA